MSGGRSATTDAGDAATGRVGAAASDRVLAASTVNAASVTPSAAAAGATADSAPSGQPPSSGSFVVDVLAPVLASMFGSPQNGSTESPLASIFLAAARRQIGAAQDSTEDTTANTSTAATTQTTSTTAFAPTALAVKASTSSKLAAGKPSVGTANTTTGAVSGSLNFNNQTGGKLTYSVASQPSSGTVTVSSAGTYTYTPTKLARDEAAVTVGNSTATFTVTASNAAASASETVTVPISPTVIKGDSTAVLQDVFSNLAAGSTITLAPKTFDTSGVLQIRVSGLTINGNGATLRATNDATSAVQVVADHVTISNLTLAANLTGPRYSTLQQHKLVIEGNYDTISNVTINGSAAAGVYVYGAGWFTLNNITVNDSRADGISMSHGAHNGVINDPVTNNTGDDGISVVSYVGDGKSCDDITINNPVVNGTTGGRGVTVVGGEDITFNNITVSHTNAAGVYVATEPSYNTLSVKDVTINGGTVTDADYNSSVVQGAVMVYAGNPGQSVTDVTIENLSISKTPTSAERNIALLQASGSHMGGITLKNITIDNATLPIIFTKVPTGAYLMTGTKVG